MKNGNINIQNFVSILMYMASNNNILVILYLFRYIHEVDTLRRPLDTLHNT